MSPEDRILFHQIHPLKLAVDWGTAFLSAWSFWEHHLVLAFVAGFLPSILTSLALIRWADLGPYRTSTVGRRLANGMTHSVEAGRFLGLLPFWGGAWAHLPVLMITGIVWILACWGWALRPPARNP